MSYLMTGIAPYSPRALFCVQSDRQPRRFIICIYTLSLDKNLISELHIQGYNIVYITSNDLWYCISTEI